MTEFGEKLLCSERRAQARLAPQIEALQGDIEHVFSTAFDDNRQVLTMYASQGSDAELGVETAAREKGPDFIALVTECKQLVCLKPELTSPQVQALLKELQSPAWQGTPRNLPGYCGKSSESGQVLSLRALLPWWNYRKPKAG